MSVPGTERRSLKKKKKKKKKKKPDRLSGGSLES